MIVYSCCNSRQFLKMPKVGCHEDSSAKFEEIGEWEGLSVKGSETHL